jgi:hypothetical protein
MSMLFDTSVRSFIDWKDTKDLTNATYLKVK